MSFSSNIKQEITENRIRRQGDAAAMLSAFTLSIGSLSYAAKLRRWGIHFVSECEQAVLFIAKLAYRYFGVEFAITRVEHERLNAVYHELLLYGSELQGFLLATGFMSLDEKGEAQYEMRIPAERIVTDTQKKAFLRGLFLACGTASEPAKAYHAEFVLKSRELCDYASELLLGFGIACKTARRKSSEILYIKAGESVEDLLALLGASSAMMEVADTRILKQANNEANRGVNCINANLDRAARTALRQAEDIRLVISVMGFNNLPESLRAVAEVRLNNYEMTLSEIAEELGIGKSAVNYRFQKLSRIADEIRQKA